jgi:general secretion pathway protein D
MKRIIALLSCFSLAQSADFAGLTNYVSHEINTNIYLDKEIEDYYIFIDDLPKEPSSRELLSIYKKVVSDNNLTLIYDKEDSFYYVAKKEMSKDDLDYYTYRVNNLVFKDIETLLTLFPKLNYKFLPQSDMVVFQSTYEQSEKIKNLLKGTDNNLHQERIKITILNTNNSKGKEFGTKISKFGVDFDYWLNLLIGTPITQTHQISNTATFNSFLTAMDDNGITEIEQSPTLLLRDGQKSSFKSVTNIPFLEQTQEITEVRTNNVQSLNYKDVGLSVIVTPKIKNDYIYLDLDLTSEDLLTDKSDIRPVTQKIEYKNSLKLLKGETILLTGLRKKSMKQIGFKVPIFGDLPGLDILFNYESESEEMENMSILIESI